MRVDFPDPDTPVTATKHPSGMSTSTFFRLCSRAPRMPRTSAPGSRRTAGTGIDFLPDKYCPVTDPRRFRSPFTAPL